MFNFAQIKNNFTIAYNQPLGFFKGAVPQALYSSAESVARIAAKSVIHMARGLYDISCDLAKVAVNLFKSDDNHASDKHDSTCEKHHAANPSKKADVKNKGEEANVKSTLEKLKDFVVDTWNQKDDTYLGKFSKHSECYPAAKIVVDAASTLQGVVQTFGEEVFDIPAKVSKSMEAGLSSAYIEGITPVKFETTHVEGGFLSIDIPHDNIEMVPLGDIAPAA